MLTNLLNLLASIKSSPLVWAQAVHFLIGYSVLLTSYRSGERRRFWLVGVIVLAWAFGIEIWYDPTYEHSPFLWDGLIDLAFYGAGALAGVLVDYFA